MNLVSGSDVIVPLPKSRYLREVNVRATLVRRGLVVTYPDFAPDYLSGVLTLSVGPKSRKKIHVN